MLVDHIGMVFFPDKIGFRILGRLSMPLFAYGVANGYSNLSSCKKRLNAYKHRLLFIGLVSQPFFLFMQGHRQQLLPFNICITWYFAVSALQIIAKNHQKTGGRSIPASLKKSLPSAILALLAYILKVEYGLYAVFVVIIIYRYRIKKRQQLSELMAMILVTLVYTLINWRYGIIQIFALAALPLLDLITLLGNKLKFPKFVFYLFYPSHMFLLGVVKNVMKG